MWDRKALDATYTANCNWNLSDVPARRKHPNSATYCFLSEVLFQNGLLAIQCSTKPHYKDAWVMQMNRSATPTSALNVLEFILEHFFFNYSHILCFFKPTELNANVNVSGKFPVIVHANYCNGKSHELSVRGLWLLGRNYTDVDSEQCRPYAIERTYYNTANWTQEVEQIMHKRMYMYDTFVRNGTLIQGSNGLEVFAVDALRR